MPEAGKRMLDIQKIEGICVMARYTAHDFICTRLILGFILLKLEIARIHLLKGGAMF